MRPSIQPSHILVCPPDTPKADLGSTRRVELRTPPSLLPASRLSTGVILTIEFLFISVLSLAFSSSLHPSESQVEALGWIGEGGAQAIQLPWMAQSQQWMIWYAWAKMLSGAVILSCGIPRRRGWARVSKLEYLAGSMMTTLFGFVCLSVGGLTLPVLASQGGLVWMSETLLGASLSLLLIAIPAYCTFWALTGIIYELRRLFSSTCDVSTDPHSDDQIDPLLDDYLELPDYLPPYSA
ncbi:hypothetical protein CROQUDRAFT_528335 [Cronartium quercuum f. sp. fusiforme G11]|uniref:Uncharacterized protein n=1 Tax=Cronartium quercuum f. sp. fusiforme G11 TaxID=708437 RepID=A0A9P6NHW3_9BASI|nr:hypothetical protein CROQUDRAFT_528335 [Cronartium quercuum f. sp. fusiforme G11]